MARKSIFQKGVLVESAIPGPIFNVNEVVPRHDYDGTKRLDTTIGNTYTLTNIDSYDQIDVFVEESQPLISQKKLEELHNDGKKVFVTLTNAIIKPYYSERLKTIVDSIKAESISFSEFSEYSE